MDMRRLLWRAVQGAGVAGLAFVLSAAPAGAVPGQRLVSGDGDTSGECMGITSSGLGTSVEMQPCSTTALHQRWELWFDPYYGHSLLKSPDPDARGRCVTFHAEGVRVTMDRCANLDTHPALYAQQVWRQRSDDGRWVQFANIAAPNQCLDVRDNGRSNVVQTWLCGPLSGPNIKGNQMWKSA